MAPHVETMTVSGDYKNRGPCPAVVSPQQTQAGCEKNSQASIPNFIQAPHSPHSISSGYSTDGELDTSANVDSATAQFQQMYVSPPELQMPGAVNYVQVPMNSCTTQQPPHQPQMYSQYMYTDQNGMVLCPQGQDVHAPLGPVQYVTGQPMMIMPPQQVQMYQSQQVLNVHHQSTETPVYPGSSQHQQHMIPTQHGTYQYTQNPTQYYDVPPATFESCSTQGLVSQQQSTQFTYVHPSQQQYLNTSHQISPITNTMSPMASPGMSDRSVGVMSDNSYPYSLENTNENEQVSLSRQLEKVWFGEFNKHFNKFAHHWDFSSAETIPPLPDSEHDQDEPEMEKFMDSAKVRFICPNCSHCWTSMKGRVLFGHVLDRKRNCGLVVFKLFGQKCQKCDGEEWVHAMWYPEEIKKTMYNICQKVGMSYYSWKKPIVRLDRRSGRPSKPHEPKSCQACSEGICKEERNFV